RSNGGAKVSPWLSPPPDFHSRTDCHCDDPPQRRLHPIAINVSRPKVNEQRRCCEMIDDVFFRAGVPVNPLSIASNDFCQTMAVSVTDVGSQTVNLRIEDMMGESYRWGRHHRLRVGRIVSCCQGSHGYPNFPQYRIEYKKSTLGCSVDRSFLQIV